MAINERHMFSGANTPTGFFSYFDNIIPIKSAKRVFCIKGGPGVGKSTFMQKIGNDLLADGKAVEFIHCSSDPDSLDGIAVPELNIAFIDGTAPHIVDPKYPGAVDEIINLGQFWNEGDIAKNKEKIISGFSEISAQFSRAYSYLAAAGSIRNDIVKTRMGAVDISKLDDITNNIIGAEIAGTGSSGKPGALRKMFATAITPDGLIEYINSLISGYNKVYVLQGNTGCGSEIILEDIVRFALKRGFYIESFYCPMDPGKKIEHILIPELSCAVCTSNEYHTIKPVDTELFKLKTIIDEGLDNECDIFNLLLDNALDELSRAKSLHDELETNYVPNMDFDSVEAYRLKIMDHIKEYSKPL